MVIKLQKEQKLYPIVEKWMKKHFRCFKTSINTGLRHGRLDVVGVRDTGGELSGDVETISIEVKRGTEAFATASGQALGYKIYANRVYLADIRNNDFTPDEIKIASHLGIGLIQIRNNKCHEILSSPHYTPMVSYNLSLLERLALARCQICNSFFDVGKPRGTKKGYFLSFVTRENIDRAIKEEKGVLFWNYEVARRKDKASIRRLGHYDSFERRYICSECTQVFFSTKTKSKN